MPYDKKKKKKEVSQWESNYLSRSKAEIYRKIDQQFLSQMSYEIAYTYLPKIGGKKCLTIAF